jgi:hypothetical protein
MPDNWELVFLIAAGAVFVPSLTVAAALFRRKRPPDEKEWDLLHRIESWALVTAIVSFPFFFAALCLLWPYWRQTGFAVWIALDVWFFVAVAVALAFRKRELPKKGEALGFLGFIHWASYYTMGAFLLLLFAVVFAFFVYMFMIFTGAIHLFD